jgi:hypothetical protein
VKRGDIEVVNYCCGSAVVSYSSIAVKERRSKRGNCSAYCVVEVAALVVASIGGEVGGVELASTMVSVVVEVVVPSLDEGLELAIVKLPALI